MHQKSVSEKPHRDLGSEGGEEKEEKKYQLNTITALALNPLFHFHKHSKEKWREKKRDEEVRLCRRYSVALDIVA